MLFTAFIVGILVVFVVAISTYNSLIQKKNAIDNAFYSIDVMLKKRYDLIPQLVETVKGYMKHERELLLQLVEARQKLTGSRMGNNDKVVLDNQVTDLLQNVMISMEAYPELKASENFLRLQGALNETEEQLAASRRFYNAAVNDYHNSIEMFPSSIVASMMGLKHRDFFSISDTEKVVPQVTFN